MPEQGYWHGLVKNLLDPCSDKPALVGGLVLSRSGHRVRKIEEKYARMFRRPDRVRVR
jgi:hypothetical protein